MGASALPCAGHCDVALCGAHRLTRWYRACVRTGHETPIDRVSRRGARGCDDRGAEAEVRRHRDGRSQGRFQRIQKLRVGRRRLSGDGQGGTSADRRCRRSRAERAWSREAYVRPIRSPASLWCAAENRYGYACGRAGHQSADVRGRHARGALARVGER